MCVVCSACTCVHYVWHSVWCCVWYAMYVWYVCGMLCVAHYVCVVWCGVVWNGQEGMLTLALLATGQPATENSEQQQCQVFPRCHSEGIRAEGKDRGIWPCQASLPG